MRDFNAKLAALGRGIVVFAFSVPVCMSDCNPRRKITTVRRYESLLPEQGRLVALHLQEWFALQSGAPGVEVHCDADATWKLEKGAVWSNAVCFPRFNDKTIQTRLDVILRRYSAHRRGAGFWVDIDSTPHNLETHLTERRFRCRKHFPGMACNLKEFVEAKASPEIEFSSVTDFSIYQKYEHPVWGPLRTPIQKHSLRRVMHLVATQPRNVFEFAAFDEGRPVGAATLYLGKSAAGIHDVAVLDGERRKGIGAALMSHMLSFAKAEGSKHAVLIASGMGESMYRRIGFREACRIAYWYRA